MLRAQIGRKTSAAKTLCLLVLCLLILCLLYRVHDWLAGQLLVIPLPAYPKFPANSQLAHELFADCGREM